MTFKKNKLEIYMQKWVKIILKIIFLQCVIREGMKSEL